MDLPALVAYSGLGSENEAWPRERLGAGDAQATLSVIRDQLMSFAGLRGAWVSVRRQRLQGLIGARQLGGAEAWEIDYLVDATKDRRLAVDLLECATIGAGKEGAQKLFLRLCSDSQLLPPVRDIGFTPYQEETLYTGTGSGAAAPVALRPSIFSDSYPLFRLYCDSTPEATRRLEAATFGEWHASQERRWLKNGLQLVHEDGGTIAAFVRAARLPQGLLLEMTVSADATAEVAGLVSAACEAADAVSEPVLVAVPRSAEALARALQAAGFRPQQEFVSFMKRTTKPLTLPKKVAVVAENAVGV
jgi:hypothetical protein